MSYPGPSSCPYSPECVEGLFSEVRSLVTGAVSFERRSSCKVGL